MRQYRRERQTRPFVQSLFDSYAVTGPGVLLSSLAVAVGFADAGDVAVHPEDVPVAAVAERHVIRGRPDLYQAYENNFRHHYSHSQAYQGRGSSGPNTRGFTGQTAPSYAPASGGGIIAYPR